MEGATDTEKTDTLATEKPDQDNKPFSVKIIRLSRFSQRCFVG
jgi:hypothetical protein